MALTGRRYEGELILWSGAPVRHPTLLWGTALLVAVGVGMLGWATYFLVAGGSEGGDPGAYVYLVVVVLFGLGVLVYGYRALAMRARGMRYVLTERRLVVVSGGATGQRVRAVRLAELGEPRLRVGRGGRTGTIRFPHRRLPLAGIAEPERVRDLIVAATGEVSADRRRDER
jgi:hypothetical protein